MRKLILGSVALFGAFSIHMVAPHAIAASRPHRSAKTQSLTTYFPAANQYPTGYKPLRVQRYADASQFFVGANLTMAARYHFVTGAMQTAFGPRNAVLAITIAWFRDPSEAGRFRAAVQSDVVDDGTQKTGVLRGLGSGRARYESGSCASCGPSSPPLDQVFFARGPIFVEITTQPSNQRLATHLGTVIDTRFKRARVR